MTLSSATTIERFVEWQDTDAAGHYHHSTVIRWVEAAESALYDALGVEGLMGVVPRVRYEVDYVDRLFYHERVDIALSVAQVGGTLGDVHVRRHRAARGDRAGTDGGGAHRSGAGPGEPVAGRCPRSAVLPRTVDPWAYGLSRSLSPASVSAMTS